MPTTAERIVAAADDLFYRRGYERTSLAEIAAAVGLARGNFYYHFRAKDDILLAVIDRRLADTRAMLAQWDDEPDPRERIGHFIDIVVTNRTAIEQSGCPVGSLVTELSKLGHANAPAAVAVFDCLRQWLRAQFEQLGRDDADELALHALMFSQGVAVLTHAYADGEFIAREVAQMRAWLDGLQPTISTPNLTLTHPSERP